MNDAAIPDLLIEIMFNKKEFTTKAPRHGERIKKMFPDFKKVFLRASVSPWLVLNSR